MVGVRFITGDHEEAELDIDEGNSLMEGAVMGGVDGIEALCGGELSCATCHVYIDDRWQSKLDPPTEGEIEMLEYAVETDARSRLSCQIVMRPDLDGLIVHVPRSQA